MKKRTLRSNQETDEGKRCAALANSLTKKAPYKGLGADSEEKHEPVSDFDTVVVDSLKALDPNRPIREADIGIQCAAANVFRRTSAMISATSDAILGPCILISENSASEIRSRNPVLKLGHSRAKVHQASLPRRKRTTTPRSPGRTREERAIADAQVNAAASALAVLERRLDKTVLRAPADGVVTVIVAEAGENIRAGQPVLAIEETGKRWLSFNAREDRLRGLTVGATVEVARQGGREATPAVVTELVPLGPFATWQAECAIGDHDRNTLRLRLDPQADAIGFEPGMTVWIHR